MSKTFLKIWSKKPSCTFRSGILCILSRRTPIAHQIAFRSWIPYPGACFAVQSSVAGAERTVAGKTSVASQRTGATHVGRTTSTARVSVRDRGSRESTAVVRHWGTAARHSSTTSGPSRSRRVAQVARAVSTGVFEAIDQVLPCSASGALHIGIATAGHSTGATHNGRAF